MTLVNGCPQDVLALNDRAIQYGDGCFTTMYVHQGRIQLWSLHLQRLQTTLARLHIPAPNWQQIYNDAAQVAHQYSSQGGVKILISRGCGGRGYSPQGCDSPQVVISHFPWPAHYLQWQQQGINLGVCQQRIGHSPMLAGMKHLNRLEQVLLKQEVESYGWLDAVVLDSDHNVIETTVANIFWRQGRTVYTPLLDRAGVAGVMRQQVLDILSGIDYKIIIENVDLASLLAADEVFITNALMALVPINRIQTTQYRQRTLFNTIRKRLITC